MSVYVGRFGAFSAALPFLVLGLGPAALPEGNDPQPGVQVQSRGALHEAFVRATALDPRPNLEVPRQPPEPIPEAPALQKPEGPNVQWIPGYWSWDPIDKDFVWTSGFWRAAPPNRQWVPGHWIQTETGWQWVDGFWAPAGQAEWDYLPTPPPSLERGTSPPLPDGSSVYVPGIWIYDSSNYVWQPGYWLACRPGWVWNPAQYVWTPRGCIFVNGYWDRRLEERGLLFAPVTFERPFWQTPDWCYRPSFIVDPLGLQACLFVRPTTGEYYFGDYFDPSATRWGLQPWLVFGQRTYDPLFAYYGWQNGANPAWTSALLQSQTAWAGGGVAGLSRLRAHHNLLAPRAVGDPVPLVAPLSQGRTPNLRLGPLSASQMMEQRAAAQRLREASRARNQAEQVVTVFRLAPGDGLGGGAVGVLATPRSTAGPGRSNSSAGAAPLPQILSTSPVTRDLPNRTFTTTTSGGSLPWAAPPAVSSRYSQPAVGSVRSFQAAPAPVLRSVPHPAVPLRPSLPSFHGGGHSGPSSHGHSPGSHR